MNQFCEMKGIMRQYSVAKTLEQNRVVEMRNRTIIETVRTMLADSKLPTTFWAYAVNTACYVQNRVLVVKPHNKNPYELFHGSRPNWLFDIDALTKLMNYKPVVARNQSNGKAGTKACNDVESKSSQDNGFQPSSDDGKNVDENPRQEIKCKDQKKEENINNTNNVNAASTNRVNAVDADEEADMNNMDITIQVSPTLTIRIHRDHPLDQVIKDLHSTTQTRNMSMSKNLEDHGFVTIIHQRTNHKNLQNCLFACFLLQEEPKKVIQALKDPRWIEAVSLEKSNKNVVGLRISISYQSMSE
nr:ribonuclease H-like domain-containing protein [Tanacetum cinerariifolium]